MKTFANFTNIGQMEISGKIGEIINKIKAASIEQSSGIEQISRTVKEMNKVVHDNASTAE